MTALEKPVSRECPEILNDEGRALQATLDPEDGGTLALKWKGLRAGSGFELGLGMLMRFAEKKASEQSEPETPAEEAPESSGSPSSPRSSRSSGTSSKVDRTEFVRYDDILSRIHILPGLTAEERTRLVDTIKSLRDIQELITKV